MPKGSRFPIDHKNDQEASNCPFFPQSLNPTEDEDVEKRTKLAPLWSDMAQLHCQSDRVAASRIDFTEHTAQRPLEVGLPARLAKCYNLAHIYEEYC